MVLAEVGEEVEGGVGVEVEEAFSRAFLVLWVAWVWVGAGVGLGEGVREGAVAEGICRWSCWTSRCRCRWLTSSKGKVLRLGNQAHLTTLVARTPHPCYHTWGFRTTPRVLFA